MKNLAKISFVLVGLIFTNFNTFSQAPTNGLVAYYPFNNFLANDESGNGRNGVFSGGVSTTPDRLGNANQAYYFNGVDGNITIPNWNILTGNAARTMSVWFKTSAPTTYRMMLSWGSIANNQSSSIGILTDGANLPNGLGFTAVYDIGLQVVNQNQYFDNIWHLMTFTHDGSTMRLYLDGVQQAVKSSNTIINTTNSNLVIGSYNGANYAYFLGSLDEIRVYNRALTATEVQQMYSAEVAPSTTTDVIKLGINRFFHITGTDNTYIGIKSGAFSSGASNTFIGVNTGLFNTGSFNSFFGTISGIANTSGQNNVFMGWASGNENTSGSDNTIIGVQAGGLNKAGSYNTNIGKLAGYDNLNGSNNTFVGAGANSYGANKVSLFNSSAIGSNAKVSINNAIVLGDFENNDLKVGVGIHNPQYRLDVKGVVNMRVGFNSPAMKVNDKEFLALDAEGDFVLSKFKIKYANENEWSDKVFEPNYHLKPIQEVAQFAFKNKHLLNMPSAEEVVKNGIEMQYIMSKLLEKIEELTIYVSEQDKTNKQQAKEIEKLKELLQNNKH